MGKGRKHHLWNIPNTLCFIRILLIPLFLYLYFNAKIASDYYLAGGILILSGFTDFLDGYIARKYDMITDFGKLIDPIADKLTQVAVAITLLYHYPLMGIVLAIIIVKDTMLFIVGLYLYQFGEVIDGANKWGKIATAYFYLIVIILVMIQLSGTLIANILIISSFVFMVIAFIFYAIELYQMDVSIRDSKHNK